MNEGLLASHAPAAGEDVISLLRTLAKPLEGMKVVHVNSTRVGGGVAEILSTLLPLMRDLGIDARWEVIEGERDFYQCTKHFHNAFQGNTVNIPDSLLRIYEDTNQLNAERFRERLEEADFVFVHDPQPAMLLKYFPHRKGKWVWRCHIDASHPYRPVWKYLKQFVAPYDASIFSLPDFVQPLPHLSYIVAPSIDPLSPKNIDLSELEIRQVYRDFRLDPQRPIMLQVSRFDRFKDPAGVIRAYRMSKAFIPTLQLVLAGGSATDDPEGAAVLNEVMTAVKGDPDAHVLDLPNDAHRTINALQRTADFVLQKSIREGFGLTVAEAMWKGKPVIGGDTGGIRLQVVNHHTGFLVNTPEGAALRIRYLHIHRGRLRTMGEQARRFVQQNFLSTRNLRDYLVIMIGLLHGSKGQSIQVS